MARRRMFCTELLGSDRYLDLDLRTQMLYIQLNINADDEGFVSSAKALCRLYGCDETDLDALEKGDFIIRFESGVVVITDWLVNNTIRKDRSTSTRFLSERCMLRVENGRYLLVGDNCQPDDNQLTTTCQPFDDHLATQNRLDKNREDKIILDQIRPDHSPSAGAGCTVGGRASDENKKPDCLEISKCLICPL